MLTSIRSTFIACLISLTCVAVSFGQTIQDTVSIQPGYTHQVWYSLSNGDVDAHINTDWDLAFQLRGFAGSILINSKNNVRVWKANKAAAQWTGMTTSDTTGVVNNPAYELFNSDTSWDFGALNRTNNTTNAFDLGWGVYDFATHVVTGDSVFFIRVGTTDVRKLLIESLNGLTYTYNFRVANLDGSNEVVRTIAKADFPSKFFAYYSIVSDSSLDREPAYNSWDLVFSQYLTTLAGGPATYKVSGVLSNDSVFVAKAYPVDVNTASPISWTFRPEINAIGYDWKSYDNTTATWTIADSTVYFVQDRQGDTWKLVFTGFGGSASGNFYFSKSPVAATGLDEVSTVRTLGLYPNPARESVRIVMELQTSEVLNIILTDISGRSIDFGQFPLASGLQTLDIDISGLTSGLYLVRAGASVSRLIVR
ncbi:MAG: T9SS type A sorting domain-containing protein [Sphingobacteriales bacterium]|nr:T9SS type A sorting domain-containing protein [Sphingobacteriales bacterium]